MYKAQDKELLRFFLEKLNNPLAQKMLDHFDNLEQIEWEYLYAMIFENSQEKKAEATQAYIARSDEVYHDAQENKKKIKQIISQMKEVIDDTQSSVDTQKLLESIKE